MLGHPSLFWGFWNFFFFQAEDGIRDGTVTGVQTCALPIFRCRTFPRSYSAANRGNWRHRSTGLAWSWRARSEERRVGKECRSRWSPEDLKKNNCYHLLIHGSVIGRRYVIGGSFVIYLQSTL